MTPQSTAFFGLVIHRARLLPLLALALFISPTLQTTEAQSRATRTLRGHVPSAAAAAPSIGRVPAANRLNIAIGLPLRDPAGLQKFLREVYDPNSSRYHQYLTPGEFTERFGPTQNDYDAVMQFAQASGFQIIGTHPNRMVLDVAASATDIEKAFNVRMNVYQHPTEGRTFYAPSNDPSVDAALPILHISGLDNFDPPRPRHSQRLGPVYQASPNAGSGPGGAYRGNDFRAAYVPGVSLTGTGQSVAMVEFDGYYTTDITTYESQAGLAAVPLTNVPVAGGVGTPGSGNSEVALDIEVAIAMAPGLSRIYVYEGPNGGTSWPTMLSKIANDNNSRQISCSWGGGGPDSTSEQIFQQMAAQGQTFFNASGDSDAFNGSIPFPSDSPNIVEVGGTTLGTTGPGGSWSSETVWNWGGGTGSSGGISTVYSIPTWQQGISMSSNGGSTTKRNVPDVALTADNVYVVYNNGGTGNFGGTSCAAPLWAGFTALVNQQAASNGQGAVGFINPAIYNIGKGANYTTDFHDTTTGNNFWSGSPAKFPAATGYDLCTGWGSPKPALITALAGGATGTTYTVTTSSSPVSGGSTSGGGTFNGNTSVTVTATANTGYTFANWTESGNVVSTSPSYTFSLTNNRTLVANFSVATGGGGQDLFSPNGGFESGAGTDWSITGNGQISQTGSYPHTGVSYAILDGVDNGTATLTHTYVTIPVTATTATFSFWLNVTTSETSVGPYDVMTVTLIDGSGVAHQLDSFSEANAGSNTAGNYSQLSYDVSAYVGQQVQIQFQATTDFSNPTTFRIDDVSLTANTPTSGNFSISTSSAPVAGGTTSGGGSFAANTTQTVTATANSGYTFTNWTENGGVVSTSPSYTFSLTADRNLVANFSSGTASSYSISVSPQPTNGGTASGGGTFSANTSRTVTATAKTGFKFINWTENGTVVSTTASYTFTLTSNRNLIANFNSTNGAGQMALPAPGSTLPSATATFSWSAGTASQYDLFVGTSAGGSDLYPGPTTTSRTATVNNLPTDGRTVYVRLWSQVGTSWVYNDYTYKAASGTTSYSISTSSSPVAGGNTSGGGTFAASASCTVIASANSGYTFSNWTENGNVVSTSASYNFTVSGNRTLVANFTTNTSSNYTITTSSSPVAGGSTSGGGTFGANTSQTVTATANSGYTFVNWTENGSVVSTSSTYTFTLTGNRNLVANFTANAGTYTITTSSSPAAGGTTTGGGTFAANSSRTVTASARFGYLFANWTENGSVVSTSTSYTFTLTGNRTLVANFSARGR